MSIAGVGRLYARRAIAGLVLALAACSGSQSASNSAYGVGDPALAAPNPAGGPINPFLTNGTAVQHALDAIAARAGKPLRIKSISAEQVRGLIVEVQEPKKHINIDQYIVGIDGTLTGPTPVKLMSLGSGPVTVADVDQSVFDPKRIAFARLSNTLRTAIKHSTPDARVIDWQFDSLRPGYTGMIYLEAARSRPNVAVAPDLSIVRIGY